MYLSVYVYKCVCMHICIHIHTHIHIWAFGTGCYRHTYTYGLLVPDVIGTHTHMGFWYRMLSAHIHIWAFGTGCYRQRCHGKAWAPAKSPEISALLYLKFLKVSALLYLLHKITTQSTFEFVGSCDTCATTRDRVRARRVKQTY